MATEPLIRTILGEGLVSSVWLDRYEEQRMEEQMRLDFNSDPVYAASKWRYVQEK